MATVNRRQAKKHRDELIELDEPPRKSRAFRNGSLAMLALLLVLAYFAPAIIARTSLRNSAVKSALELDGTITLGSLSLGWFSPVVVQNVELRDADDRPLAEVGEIRTSKSLINLLLNLGDVGQVDIQQPTLHIVCDLDETNLERTFSKLIEREEEAQVAVAVKITDGTVHIEDVTAGRSFKVEGLAADCQIADRQEPIVLAASGNLNDSNQNGRFNLDLRTHRSEDGKNPVASGKIQCECSALPLELADPILRRKVEGASLSGRLSSRLSGAWGTLAESGEASIQGETLVTHLVFAADAIGRDQIKLERVEVPCHLIQRGETLEVQQLGMRCELGNLAVTGSCKMDTFSAEDTLAALLRETYKVDGEVDLVAVARVLPETLRIREGTEITSGKIRLAVASGHEDGEPVWSGQIDASHLGATSDGKALVWENPLAIDFAARQTKNGLVLDRGECTSSFLHLNASGSASDLTAHGNFDLARLVSELKQFADLSDLKLAGQGEAKLELKRGEADQFTALGRFETTGFQFVPIAGGQPWHEDKLVATLELGGKFENESLQRIDRGMVTVDLGGERLSAQLRQPVDSPSATAAWPLVCRWKGQLAPWATRLDACLGMKGWALNGSGQAEAQVTLSQSSIDVESSKADFAQLHVWGNDWFINEPAVSATCQASWNRELRRGEISSMRMTSGTTAAVVSNAVLKTSDDGNWQLDGGTAQFGADLVTLYRWRQDPRVPAKWRVSGRMAAQAKIKADAQVTTAQLDGVVDQLVLVDLSQPGTGTRSGTWQEPRLTMAALAAYRPATQQLELQQAKLLAAAIQANVQGVVPLADEGGNLDLKGTLQYDWSQLAAIWQPLLGQGAQIAGAQTRQFALGGQLTGSPLSADSWSKVNGNAAIGWSGMNVHGFTVGAGDIVANVAGGEVRINPLDVAVSDGRFTFAPVVRLTPAPAELYIPRGPILTNVHLTPEMCKRGLKFVAPIVAETTVAEGRFSVNMDGGRVPLFDPKGGDVAGHMAIRAQVKPGPVAQEFMVVVNELFSVLKKGNFQPLNEQTGSLLSIDTSDVEFRMVQRRMYHKNLKFVLGTMPITTYGSVGLDDESLSMVAEIPLQANLLGKDLSLGGLDGQVMQLPIGGTLSKPQLDRGALRQLTASLLQGLTRGVLQNELGKQLDRLLPLRQSTVPAP